MRSSAPGESSTVRESTLEAIANAIRDGTFALMRPVTTFTDGRWVARTRWMPDRARLLRDLDDRVLDLATLAHDQVGELVDDQHDVGHPLGGALAVDRDRARAVAPTPSAVAPAAALASGRALNAAMLRTLCAASSL